MDIATLPKDKKIILFDGVCNLCDASVLYIIQHDKKDIFRFASLQSEIGLAILKHIKINNLAIDSIILYEPNSGHSYKSKALLKIANELGGIFKLWNLVAIFPTPFLNLVYDYIAKNRYRWFGKKESCRLPSPELLAKFLA